jgi:hypothetical protein
MPRFYRTFSLLNSTLLRANPLLDRLDPIAPTVAPTLIALHPAITNLDTLLHNATPLLTQLRPAVHSLANTATVGVPVIDELNPSLVQLENKILPGLDQRFPEEGGRPLYELLGGPIVGLGNLSHFFDSNGNLGNLTLGGNAFNQTSSSILPCNIDFSGKDLLVCETLSQALATYTNLGTSFLQSLRRGPGLGSWIGNAIGGNTKFDALRAKLSGLYPALGKWLFNAGHGGIKLK